MIILICLLLYYYYPKLSKVLDIFVFIVFLFWFCAFIILSIFMRDYGLYLFILIFVVIPYAVLLIYRVNIRLRQSKKYTYSNLVQFLLDALSFILFLFTAWLYWNQYKYFPDGTPLSILLYISFIHFITTILFIYRSKLYIDELKVIGTKKESIYNFLKIIGYGYIIIFLISTIIKLVT